MFFGTTVGIARNVLADVARHHAAVEVVGAAGGEADIEADVLPL